MEKKILVLIATESNKETAVCIAKLLIRKKLAACISFKEIQSLYSWQGKLEYSNEIEIIIKSKPNKLNPLLESLKKELSYEIPQLIYKVFESEENYYKWITKSIG